MRPEVSKKSLNHGLLYDPVQVNAEVEANVGVASYTTYIKKVKDENVAMVKRRQAIYRELRLLENKMFRNFSKLGKYEGFLIVLRQQIFRQITTGKILDARRKLFSETT